MSPTTKIPALAVVCLVPFALARARAGAAEAGPIESQGGAVMRAPYVYGPGSSGVGYYAAPRTASAAASRTPGPIYRGPGTGPRRFREFGTGRSVRLAKPWLNPRD